jgi:hypothetical protein
MFACLRHRMSVPVSEISIFREGLSAIDSVYTGSNTSPDINIIRNALLALNSAQNLQAR